MKTSYSKRALLLTILLIIIAIVCVLWIFLTSGSVAIHPFMKAADYTTDYTVYIYSDSKLINSLPLGNTTETLVIPSQNGGSNTIVIKENSVTVLEASCPDRICMHMKQSPANPLPIICLPNDLVIELKKNSTKEGQPLDAITY